MQSAYASILLAMNPVPASQKGISKTLKSGDDSFMDMISEKMSGFESRTNHSSFIKAGLVDSKSYAFQGGKGRLSAGLGERPAAAPNARITEGSGTPDTSGAVIKSDKADTGYLAEVAENSGEKKGKAEDADYIESMIALLENILAMLNGNAASSGLSAGEVQNTSEAISPEQLKVIADGIENLKAMLGDQDIKSLIPGSTESELNSLLDDLKILLGENYGSPEKAGLVIEAENEAALDTALIDRLKAQCSDLIEKLQGVTKPVDPENAEEMVSEAMDLSTSEAGESRENGNDDDVSHETQALAHEKEKPEAETDEKTGSEKHETVISKSSIEVKDIIPDDSAVVSIQNTIDSLDAATEKVPVSAFEKLLPEKVTEQVVMKVKLMAGENRQEMEMQLKPESLGKLTLKIVHERGEILAKITAENEQVKGILEGSMQQLKDALEKSGVSVQSLSVSVGNKGKREPNSESAANSKATTGKIGKAEGSAPVPKIANIGYTGSYDSYYDEGNQINLTA